MNQPTCGPKREWDCDRPLAGAGRLNAEAWPLNDPRLRWYAYARVAWWDLLVAVGAGPGDEVLLPDLICDVMVDPLHRLGLQPRYYRSEPMRPLTAADLIPQVGPRTRAVLAVHYFGLPRPIADAAGYCRSLKIPFVEDVAQGFLSVDGRRLLGGEGDAALFSFRKTLSLPHGAGLVANDPQLARAVSHRVTRLSPGRRDVWRYWSKRLDGQYLGGRLERVCDRFRGRGADPLDPYGERCAPFAHVFLRKVPVRLRITKRRSALERHSVDRGRGPDPFDNCLVRPSRTARWLIARTDLEAEGQRRRAAFARLAGRWKNEELPGKPLVSGLEAGWVPYAFPVRSANAGTEALVAQLRSVGFAAELWPRLPLDAPAGVRKRRWVLVSL